MPRPKPSFRRRLVGEALRFFREQLDLSMHDAAEILGCHVSKISRIETGQLGVKAAEFRELLREYDASDAQTDLLLALLGYAHPLPKLRWWRDAADVLPSSLLDYAMVEEHASSICTYGAALVPPLLQTHAYARAVALASPQIPESAIDTVADAATARQTMTLEARSAAVDVVIAEDALHRQVGGEGVLGKQLHRLLEIADPRAYPWVTLKVLPSTSGPSPLSDSGGVSLLRFKALPRLGAVYLEGPDAGQCLHDQHDVTAYTGAFHAAGQAALPLIESRQLLEALAVRTDS